MTFPAGENTKTLEHASSIFEDLLDADISKKECVVAIGGGSITDLAAFIAQQLLRGVPLILMPTTIIAQIDAAIGGKNGLNFRGKKNRIGSFYFPQQVICDTAFLDTLSNRHIHSGVAEIIKVFAVTDCRLLKELKSEKGTTVLDVSGKRDHLIAQSIQAKVDLLNDDPFERSQKRLLNFGHSFAHFFEEASHFCLTHGEAVMLSMLCESHIALLAGAGSVSAHEDLSSTIIDNLTPACREFRFPPRRMYEVVEDTRRIRGGHDNLVVLSSSGYGTFMKDFDPALAPAAWEEVLVYISKEATHHV
jgi:3-dehydroquinate synthase